MNMSQAMKVDCLVKQQVRYLRSHREGKSRMLDEVCEDYEHDRKYAIKLLGRGRAIPDRSLSMR